MPKKIAIHYVQGPFIIDLISSLPLDNLVPLTAYNKDLTKALSTMKIFRVLRLNRMIKYMEA